MTPTEESRRPVRVLAPNEVVNAPKPIATTQAADRFNRTLTTTLRHTEKGRPLVTPDARGERNIRPPVLPFLPVFLPELDEGSKTTQQQPVEAFRPAQARETTPNQDQPPPQYKRTEPAVTPPASLTDTGRWAENTAQKVAMLCNRADSAFSSWSVTLPMDAQVLPETDLVLKMSPHGLGLVFRTQSAVSSKLITAHKQRLHDVLLRTRGVPQDVEIDLA